jgi:hypothetical protein
LSHLLLKLTDPCVGAIQRLLLHQHALSQIIGRVGKAADNIADELECVGVFFCGAHTFETSKQILDEVLLLRVHCLDPRQRSPRQPARPSAYRFSGSAEIVVAGITFR